MAAVNIPRSKVGVKTKVVQRAPALSKTESIESNVLDENHENIIFVWFDPHAQSNLNIIGLLRAINNTVQAFNDSSTCFNFIKSSKEKIFFIGSINNDQLITTVQNFPAVEAIFILDLNAESSRGDYSKLFGVFNQHEELLRAVKDALDTFEQIQFEEFAFEEDKVFLWSQLWREEV